ncbi:NAD(P)/FAD-dependent oxidoreductase [Desertibacillus haloalkaliphilus]|uniref:NAD(P)/FAD-dependent oxidoreductase n=1 Tax=Desertibacillus haloalkaliphilus TaxID=1328930 RepID=UPI001C259A0C|nr:FAD-dependent oxidoreductase [Desertibacillus haloalkaliphilus]MBU8907907.1 FAD-binding oxidoreductase [Desertibacillus haloalkaliphilus]
MKEYIVIGAGILGASTAYHLAKAGASVVVVDRNDLGQATDAAAGIVCPWLSQRRNKAWYRLVKAGARYYTSLHEQLHADGQTETGYERVGAISLHTDEKKLDQMEKRAYQRREDAPEIGEITRLSAAETRALVPALAEEYQSIHISGGARVNGRALRNALVSAAKKHGATFLQGEARLTSTQSKVTGIEVDGKHLTASEVIVTAGAWASELFKPLGIGFDVSPQKAQIVHLRLPDIDTSQWPVVMPPNNQYLLTYDDGRIVVGATHEDEAGFDCRVTMGGVHEIFHKALMVAPQLETSTVLEVRVGFRPFTPGFLPIIGRIPQMDGLLTANGLGASGLTSGPFLGAELAKLALGQGTGLPLEDYDVRHALVDM